MWLVQYATATIADGTLALVTLLSMRVLGPRWENHPTLGPLLAAMLVTMTYWLLLILLRRYTNLLPRSASYAMLAAVSLTWAFVYVSVKGHDDPPIFAFLGPVIWLPALLVYRLPFHINGKPATLD